MKFWNIFKKVHSNDHNLIGAIEEVIEAKANSKRRKEFSPFTAFPDVSRAYIKVSRWDELFKKFGIKKRESGGELHYIKYVNKDLNRYKLRCIRRLRRARDSGKHRVYWRLAMFLVKRSKIFFLDALRHCNIKFHRNMTFYEILKLYKEYVAIADASQFFHQSYMSKVQREVRVINNKIITPRQRTQLNKYIDFKRVYIEKSNGKYRPLGVPTLVWRIYLHQINQFLVLGLNHTISTRQHGFRPEQGTLTAWLEVLKYIKLPYIYEFDYKGFFDKIDIHVISHVLRERNVSEEWVDLIERLNDSRPKLPDKQLLDESETEINSEYIEHIRWEKAENNDADLGMLGEYGEDWRVFGVPQGAPTSPFLSILVLDWAFKKVKAIIVRYADDGLIFSRIPIKLPKPERMEIANIEYAYEKSGEIKTAGVWLKVMKFLGLVYDGDKDQLKAETRKGSKLIMDKEDLIKEYNNRVSDYPEKDSKYSWETFIKSEISGFIQSRLYLGSWNLEDFMQNFNLNYIKGSWCAKYMKFRETQREELVPQIELTVFNSSSICLKSILEAMKDYQRYNYRWKNYKKKGGGLENSVAKDISRTRRGKNPFTDGLYLPWEG